MGRKITKQITIYISIIKHTKIDEPSSNWNVSKIASIASLIFIALKIALLITAQGP